MGKIPEKGFMGIALKLAESSDPFPNPKVGAVLVNGGKVIGKGFHKAPGLPHAEMEAMEDARKLGNEPEIAGATLYVTLEPCSHESKRTPPCTKAIIDSGIKKVVFGMRDPNPLVTGREVLEAAGIEVEGPACAGEAESMNKRYMDNVSAKPFVTLKLAMSADGRSATRTGDSKWISNEESRAHVQLMRADSDAVIVGAQTVRTDNPMLTCRIMEGRNPFRIVVSSSLSIPKSSRVFENGDGKTVIFTSGSAPQERISALGECPGARIITCGESQVDMQKMLLALSAMGMKKILIEGGSTLAACAIEAGIVDRLCLFVAPMLIGGERAKGALGGAGAESISAAVKLGAPKVRKFGRDLLLEYDVEREP